MKTRTKRAIRLFTELREYKGDKRGATRFYKRLSSRIERRRWRLLLSAERSKRVNRGIKYDLYALGSLWCWRETWRGIQIDPVYQFHYENILWRVNRWLDEKAESKRNRR